MPKKFKFVQFQNNLFKFCASQVVKSMVETTASVDNFKRSYLTCMKKKMQREGVFREMKLRRSYEKPSEKKAREKAEAVRRARKLERKRLEREGF